MIDSIFSSNKEYNQRFIFRSRMRHGGPTSSQSRFASKRSHANISASRRSVTLSEGKLEAKTAVGHRLGITVRKN